MEQVDDGTAADRVIAWLRRRLRAPKRANSWGYHEVSRVLRYAIDAKALP